MAMYDTDYSVRYVSQFPKHLLRKTTIPETLEIEKAKQGTEQVLSVMLGSAVIFDKAHALPNRHTRLYATSLSPSLSRKTCLEAKRSTIGSTPFV